MRNEAELRRLHEAVYPGQWAIGAYRDTRVGIALLCYFAGAELEMRRKVTT